MNNEIIKIVKIVTGSVLFSLGVLFFIMPAGLNAGGITGSAMIFNRLVQTMIGRSLSIDLTGIFNLLLNLPLYFLAVRSISRSFCMRTLLSLIVQTITMSLIPVPDQPLMPDMVSNCLFGALVSGIGIGLCLQSSGCAGGLDILGFYFSKTKPDFSVGKVSILFNIFLFTFYTFMTDIQSSLYSILFVAVMYVVADKVHYQNINMSAMIFTAKTDLKNVIIKELHRGVTCWKGQGAYTGKEKEILMVALNKSEVRHLQHLIRREDPDAFVILNEGEKISGGFEKRL